MWSNKWPKRKAKKAQRKWMKRWVKNHGDPKTGNVKNDQTEPR